MTTNSIKARQVSVIRPALIKRRIAKRVSRAFLAAMLSVAARVDVWASLACSDNSPTVSFVESEPASDGRVDGASFSGPATRLEATLGPAPAVFCAPGDRTDTGALLFDSGPSRVGVGEVDFGEVSWPVEGETSTAAV